MTSMTFVTSRLFYRIAAVLLVLFALAHTMGFLHFVPATADGAAVRDAMMHVRFPIGKTSYTYQDFYVGFGLFCSAYMLFAAVLAWQLARFVSIAPRVVRPLGALLLAAQAVCLVLSCVYFFPAPIISSALVVAALTGAVWLAPNPANAAVAPAR